MSTNQNLELIALELIAEQSSPIGASRLEAEWRSRGIDKGEATAGRFLRQLDLAGYTLLQNRTLGRVLSDAGHERLLELQREASTSDAEQALRSALDITTRSELIELLGVRKLVECETARRAAIHATDDDIREMKALVSSSCEASDDASMRESMAFHRAVANASRSPLLIAFMNLLQDPTNDPLENTLSRMTRVSGITDALHHDHDDLIAAIERRSPDDAVRIMESHFQNLIAAASQTD